VLSPVLQAVNIFLPSVQFKKIYSQDLATNSNSCLVWRSFTKWLPITHDFTGGGSYKVWDIIYDL